MRENDASAVFGVDADPQQKSQMYCKQNKQYHCGDVYSLLLSSKLQELRKLINLVWVNLERIFEKTNEN